MFNNDPLSAYILRNIHEYGTLTDTMSLLKYRHNLTKLIPYEQLFIQTFHHHGNLISEQSASEPNPLFQLTLDTT
jgi:hypothetical protein